METSFHEKRYFLRKPLNLEVTIRDMHSEAENTGTTAKLASRDLSAGGVFLETMNPCGINELLLLRFNLPNATGTIKTMGKVVWKNTDNPLHPKGVGVEFEHMSFDDKKQIHDYIQSAPLVKN